MERHAKYHVHLQFDERFGHMPFAFLILSTPGGIVRSQALEFGLPQPCARRLSTLLGTPQEALERGGSSRVLP